METIVIIAVAGAVGGLLKSLVEQHGAVALPKIETTNGNKYVHLGFIGNLVVGAVVAVMTATTPISALLSGVSSAFFAEKILERGNIIPLPGDNK